VKVNVATVTLSDSGKVNQVAYDKDKDNNYQEHKEIIEKMATKEDVRKIDTSVQKILDVLIDPIKAEKIIKERKTKNKEKGKLGG
jgi:hypothetical protein